MEITVATDDVVCIQFEARGSFLFVTPDGRTVERFAPCAGELVYDGTDRQDAYDSGYDAAMAEVAAVKQAARDKRAVKKAASVTISASTERN